MGEVIDLNRRRDPEWLKKGWAILDKLTPDERNAVIVHVFNLALEDVKAGVDGQPHERFFAAIDEIYTAANPHRHCYFCTDIDGNAVEYTEAISICPICLVKVTNILSKFGIERKRKKEK
uniref:Uncharacterized protein n=2 Tax=viral metagenome TaxID=1070528 RepID=A0A6H1Z9L4_9ZZZZ